MTTLVGDDVSDINSAMGWGAGIEGEYRLSKAAGFSIGMLYTRNRFRSDETVTMDGNDDYYREFSDACFVQEHLQTPVMLNVHPASHLVLKVGVQPRLLLSANMSCHVKGSFADYSKRPNYPFAVKDLPRLPFEYDQKSQVRGTFDKIGLAIPVGLSYDWKNIVIDCRCSYSLSAEAGSDGNELFLMLSLGYKFNL